MKEEISPDEFINLAINNQLEYKVFGICTCDNCYHKLLHMCVNNKILDNITIVTMDHYNIQTLLIYSINTNPNLN